MRNLQQFLTQYPDRESNSELSFSRGAGSWPVQVSGYKETLMTVVCVAADVPATRYAHLGSRGNLQHKAAAAGVLSVQRQISPHELHHTLAEEKSQSEALGEHIELCELLKDKFCLLCRDARARFIARGGSPGQSVGGRNRPRNHHGYVGVFNKTIGPRIELRKEFYEETGHKFHMYTMTSFLTLCTDNKGKSIDKTTIDEVELFSSVMRHKVSRAELRAYYASLDDMKERTARTI